LFKLALGVPKLEVAHFDLLAWRYDAVLANAILDHVLVLLDLVLFSLKLLSLLVHTVQLKLDRVLQVHLLVLRSLLLHLDLDLEFSPFAFSLPPLIDHFHLLVKQLCVLLLFKR
jgi:hypothetical protein